MKVSFYLDKGNLDKLNQASVFCSITYNGNRIRRKIKKVKVLLSQWDNRKGRVKASKKAEAYNYYIEFNKIISEYESKVEDIIRYYLLKELTPSKEEFISKLEAEDTVDLNYDFFGCFQEFIDKNKFTKAERTIKSYVTTKNFLKDYEEYFEVKLSFEDIGFDFFEKLRNYAFEIKQTKNNYFSKLIGVLKTFLSWAKEKDYNSNLDFKKFKAKEDDTEVVYLTIDELMILFNYEFETSRLNHVRDVYCFGCFTGLRFSDIKQLKASNVFDGHLLLNIQKTKKIGQNIPLNNYAKKILERYKETIYEPLPVISSQKFNKYIKECCKITQFDTQTTITRFVGQKRVDKIVPKYEVITSHTARKTFVTNSLILGMKEMVVRNITGHKKEESFRKYVKIAEDFKRDEMDNTWNKI